VETKAKTQKNEIFYYRSAPNFELTAAEVKLNNAAILREENLL